MLHVGKQFCIIPPRPPATPPCLPLCGSLQPSQQPSPYLLPALQPSALSDIPEPLTVLSFFGSTPGGGGRTDLRSPFTRCPRYLHFPRLSVHRCNQGKWALGFHLSPGRRRPWVRVFSKYSITLPAVHHGEKPCLAQASLPACIPGNRKHILLDANRTDCCSSSGCRWPSGPGWQSTVQLR